MITIPLAAGDLDQEIQLRKPTTSRDTYGAVSRTYTDDDAVWAHVEYERPRERVTGTEQVRNAVYASATIRPHSDVTTGWQVQYRGADWNITGILHIGYAEAMVLELETGLTVETL